jgi:AmiR/NasT family two-component response regulator
MLNNAESGWDELMSEERSLEEYLEKYNSKLNREQICGKVKEILMIDYLKDIGSRMGYKVI